MIRIGILLSLTAILGCDTMDRSFSPWSECESQLDCDMYQICTIVDPDEPAICLQECASNVPCTPGYVCTPLVTFTRQVCVYTGIWDE